MTDIDWKALSAPFPENVITKKPKFRVPKVNGKTDYSKYVHCDICGGNHPPTAVHLDYVGHADITTRLNEVCGQGGWSIEPMAYTDAGTPYQCDGGMWCWMTIAGVRKMCFGDAQGKEGPDAIKEMIGDAIRNGAMRFGVGTYLWSKSEAAESLREPESRQKAPAKKPVRTKAIKPLDALKNEMTLYLKGFEPEARKDAAVKLTEGLLESFAIEKMADATDEQLKNMTETVHNICTAGKVEQ